MWWDIYPTSRKRENDDLGQKVLQEDQILGQYEVDKLKGWRRWSLVPSLQKEAGKRKRHKYRVMWDLLMRGIDIYVSLIFFVKYDTAKALMDDAYR